MKKIIINSIFALIIGVSGLALTANNACANAHLVKKLPQQTNTCTQLWNNCVATAIEQYDNGGYDFDTFYMFYENICPGAYDDCTQN